MNGRLGAIGWLFQSETQRVWNRFLGAKRQQVVREFRGGFESVSVGLTTEPGLFSMLVLGLFWGAEMGLFSGLLCCSKWARLLGYFWSQNGTETEEKHGWYEAALLADFWAVFGIVSGWLRTV